MSVVYNFGLLSCFVIQNSTEKTIKFTFFIVYLLFKSHKINYTTYKFHNFLKIEFLRRKNF